MKKDLMETDKFTGIPFFIEDNDIYLDLEPLAEDIYFTKSDLEDILNTLKQREEHD